MPTVIDYAKEQLNDARQHDSEHVSLPIDAAEILIEYADIAWRVRRVTRIAFIAFDWADKTLRKNFSDVCYAMERTGQ